jgi:hypothetical protein
MPGFDSGRTHDLSALLALCEEIEPLWTFLRPDLLRLSAYAVNIRYPGESADRSEAVEALIIARRSRKIFRESMALEDRKRVERRAAEGGGKSVRKNDRSKVRRPRSSRSNNQ